MESTGMEVIRRRARKTLADINNGNIPQGNFVSSSVNNKKKLVEWISRPLQPAQFDYNIREVFDQDIKNAYNKSVHFNTHQFEKVSCFL